MNVSCCKRLGVTATTFGRLLRASHIREHRKQYVDYDLLRFRLKQCLLSHKKNGATAAATTQGWADFDLLLLQCWHSTFDHFEEKLRWVVHSLMETIAIVESEFVL